MERNNIEMNGLDYFKLDKKGQDDISNLLYHFKFELEDVYEIEDFIFLSIDNLDISIDFEVRMNFDNKTYFVDENERFGTYFVNDDGLNGLLLYDSNRHYCYKSDILL